MFQNAISVIKPRNIWLTAQTARSPYTEWSPVCRVLTRRHAKLHAVIRRSASQCCSCQFQPFLSFNIRLYKVEIQGLLVECSQDWTTSHLTSHPWVCQFTDTLTLILEPSWVLLYNCNGDHSRALHCVAWGLVLYTQLYNVAVWPDVSLWCGKMRLPKGQINFFRSITFESHEKYIGVEPVSSSRCSGFKYYGHNQRGYTNQKLECCSLLDKTYGESVFWRINDFFYNC